MTARTIKQSWNHFLTDEKHRQSLRFFYNAVMTNRKIFLNICFIVTLFGTVFFTGEYLWVATLSWAVLIALSVVSFSYIIFSIFFFASFFTSAGFFPHLFFTIKHFHIALLIAALIEMFRTTLWNTLREGIRKSKTLWPAWGILALSLLPLFHSLPSAATLKLSLNFVTVLLSLTYVLGLVSDGALLRQSLIFFILGVASQLVYGIIHDYLYPLPFANHLLHNNHLGVFAALTLFYAFPLMLISRKEIRWQRPVSFICSLALGAGLLYSCTRIAWLSFLLSFIVFVTLLYGHEKKNKGRKSLIVYCLLCLAGMIAIASVYEPVFQRLRYLDALVSWKAWHYTFHDQQNFGFFGINRLNQLYSLNHLFPHHGLFGIGFEHEILDFHGLYFTLLGGSGLAGLLLFFYFMRNLFHRLLAALKEPQDHEIFYLRAGAFCALLVWFLSSLMETLFLQYGIWFSAVIVILLSCPSFMKGKPSYEKH